MKLYDITRPVTPWLAAWPGDAPYSHSWVMRLDQGNSINLSTLNLSAHTGTHADAPYHFDEAGIRIGEMPLDHYLGPATVVELDVQGEVQPKHLAHLDLNGIERLLVKSSASLRPDEEWEEAFIYLAPATARLLGEHEICLFGTDAPSVDPQESKTLDAHRALHQGGVAILEMLQLRDVPPGEYELIALPLKLDVDGSPVRAILRTMD